MDQQERRGDYLTDDSNLALSAYLIDDAQKTIIHALEMLDDIKIEYPHQKWAEYKVVHHQITDLLSELIELNHFARKHFIKEQ